jgi:hypothetical protein
MQAGLGGLVGGLEARLAEGEHADSGSAHADHQDHQFGEHAETHAWPVTSRGF